MFKVTVHFLFFKILLPNQIVYNQKDYIFHAIRVKLVVLGNRMKLNYNSKKIWFGNKI